MKLRATKRQYTLRNISDYLDSSLRNLAKTQNKSLNQLILDILSGSAQGRIAAEAPQHHDLDSLIGSWIDDSAFDHAIEQQSEIDPDLWK